MRREEIAGKTVMILGAGRAQVPLVKAARRLGLRTLAASTPGDWPCLSLADEASLTDISDPEAVLEAARAHKIDGILTCCMDTGVPALGRVCQELGLPGPSYPAACTARNKRSMKEAFLVGGVRCARHLAVQDEEQCREAVKELGLPVVLKAVDLMGSRGIVFCKTLQEALTWFPRVMEQTVQDYCLVEEFLSGELFDGEGMVQNGELVFTLLNNSHLVKADVPTSVGHSWPWRHEEAAGEEARAQMAAAVRALGLDNTAFDCDLMLRDGKVYVIELNARAGATCLPLVISRAYGIDYYEVLLLASLGVEVSAFFQNPRRAGIAARMVTADQDGRLTRIRRDERTLELLKRDFDLFLSLSPEPGDELRRYRNGRDSLGEAIVTAPTLSEAEEALERALACLSFDME